jgi:hypothetical protein
MLLVLAACEAGPDNRATDLPEPSGPPAVQQLQAEEPAKAS